MEKGSRLRKLWVNIFSVFPSDIYLDDNLFSQEGDSVNLVAEVGQPAWT